MGKKSSHKNLRKLAAELPEITVYRKIGSLVKRTELTDAEVEHLSKQNIKTDSDIYRKVESVPGPVNHYRNLKRILEKDGSEGVLGYVSAVNRFHAQRLQQGTTLGPKPKIKETDFAPTFDEGEE